MRKRVSNIIIGLIVLAIGIFLIGNITGLFKFNLFFEGWWTVLIMIAAVISMISDRPNIFNVYFLLFGAAMLLKYRGIFNEEVSGWLVALALLVVIIGLKLILGAFFPSKTKIYFTDDGEKKTVYESNTGDEENVIFSEKIEKYNDREFKGASYSVVFGRLVLDLTGAAVTDGAYLNVECVFGGVEVIVPADVNVNVTKSAVFGEARNLASRPAMTKVINGAIEAVFGSVRIH